MSSISSLLIECLKDFNAILAVTDFAVLESEVPRNLWKDELGRLRVWASNIGAHQTGQSSLDFRLRDTSHIKDQTVRLLQRLRRILKDLEGLLHDPDSDRILALSEEDEESETQEIYHSLVDAINCLFQLSMVIRRPIQHDRLLGTKRADAAPFEPYDRVHVGQKYPQLTQVVADRLGSAISRRRATLKYRERHHAKLSKGIHHVGDDRKDGTSTQLSETIATGFEEPSITFDDTASTSGASQTSYAPSLWEGSDRLTVPPPPKASANGQPFECPYCFYIVMVRNKASWVRHVFRDLMPYTCIFPECTVPNQLYNSRREWFHHMRSSHRSELESQAHCPLQCGATSISAVQLESHVGRHLEELALFAIPRAIPDYDEDPENHHSTGFRTDDSKPDETDTGSSVIEGIIDDNTHERVANEFAASTIDDPGRTDDTLSPNDHGGSHNEHEFRLGYDSVDRDSESQADVESPDPLTHDEWTEFSKQMVERQVLRSFGLHFEETQEKYYVSGKLSHEEIASILRQSRIIGKRRERRASEAEQRSDMPQSMVNSADGSSSRPPHDNDPSLPEGQRKTEVISTQPEDVSDESADTTTYSHWDLHALRIVEVEQRQSMPQVEGLEDGTTETPKGALISPRELFLEEGGDQVIWPNAPFENLNGDDRTGRKPRWTKISRHLVNPEALEEAGERFEERGAFVVVLRVLDQEDVARLAESTARIRERRVVSELHQPNEESTQQNLREVAPKGRLGSAAIEGYFEVLEGLSLDSDRQQAKTSSKSFLEEPKLPRRLYSRRQESDSNLSSDDEFENRIPAKNNSEDEGGKLDAEPVTSHSAGESRLSATREYRVRRTEVKYSGDNPWFELRERVWG
ncbi:hypothetical protein PV08_11993 [Exophiala spinifera]|uniref:C2H2-type domain-containing protein n=1 Tax=Exophiala spinifera TaxID=91928 RepID=A0A0D1ZA46_9EURO|nr:uncharacterized protein PV08_11993 [Exophiala spinifera]KIW09892.1 hypothetical protein PV08_11993 [Exophiala spinifera]